MSINLVETVQQNLGYQPLQKIDPNTQQVVKHENTPAEDKFSQAAIPAVLTGLYRYAQSNEGAAAILLNTAGTDWLNEIFGENKDKAIEAVAVYASQTNEYCCGKMNDIARETILLLKTHLPAATTNDVTAFFDQQRNNILLHLPADLQIGTLLNDNGLDDNTNKMDGGISGLIQNIGAIFSSSGSDAGDKPQ